MSAIDKFFKLSIVVAAVIVSGAVTYHYAVYIPQRDAALDAERRKETARAMEVARSNSEAQARRAAAEKLDEEQRKLEINIRYESCTRLAQMNYSAGWDSNCKRIEDTRRKSHADCLKNALTRPNCDNLYPAPVQQDSCALPTALAENLSRLMEQSKSRCLQELQLGLR